MKNKKLFIWCSPHQMTAEQEQSLKQEGIVLKLKDLNPDLYARMLNIKHDTNVDSLARDILALAREHKAILVQPIGDARFQFALGRQVGYIEGLAINENVDENWFVYVWYSQNENVEKTDFKGWDKF